MDLLLGQKEHYYIFIELSLATFNELYFILGSTHCSKSSFFVQKFNFVSRENCRFFGLKTRENVVVLDFLAVENFDFTRKIVKKNLGKNFVKMLWFFIFFLTLFLRAKTRKVSKQNFFSSIAYYTHTIRKVEFLSKNQIFVQKFNFD